MRKLFLKISMSIDGFVAGPNGETDWVFRSSDEESRKWVVDVISRAGIHAVGRKSWESWTTFWPSATGPFAPLMNSIPKVVFTRAGIVANEPTAADSDVVRGWKQPRVAAGDLVEEVQRLKAEPGGPILAQGGASFVRSLVEHDLIDEYYLPVHPIVLGTGLSIFSAAKPMDLELVEATPFPKGTVGHVYRRR